MLFTSLSFFVFLPIVLILYWLFKSNRKLQNVILLIASYIFYGWWDWRFCFLLFLSSTIGFFIAAWIEKSNSNSTRKNLMTFSLLYHLGLLCYFKYANFFIGSFADFANAIGWKLNFVPLNIILPLAISFFTFHILGYTFDVYQRTSSAAKNYIDFITHVAFFPQLVAGPIERASHLLPQFEQPRNFNLEKIKDGARQMLWGFFKKIVIADAFATDVNYIFHNHADLHGSTIALGAILFTFQMYCDFSGYSDIALGTARLMGFELLQNFNYPFFSKSISEFWRKWHISLSTWIMDYIFTPISFLKREWGMWGVIYAALVAFTLSGLWHGANWTFIIWGLLHGIAIAYEMLTRKRRKKWAKKSNPMIYGIISCILVLTFWAFTQLIFRAESLHQLISLLSKLFSSSLFSGIELSAVYFLWAPFLMLIEWLQRKKPYALEIHDLPYYVRWVSYALIIVCIFSSNNLNNQTEFIYFQF